MLRTLLQKLQNQLQTLQCAIAAGLSKRFEQLSTKGKKLALLFFCLAMGGWSLWILIRAVHEPVGGAAIDIQPIHRPAHTGESGEPPPKAAVMFSPGLVEEVKGFQHYLDSLRQDPHGSQVYDSLAKARPGLIDSLNMVEQLLQLTQTK